MTWIPADLLIASNGRLGARSHQRSSHGLTPSRFVTSSGCFLRARKPRGEALSPKSPPHQKSRRSSCFARVPSRSQFGDSFLREHRLSLMHGRLGRNANPRHTLLRSSENGRFFCFLIPRFTQKRTVPEKNWFNYSHVLWYGRIITKSITSDICLYRNIPLLRTVATRPADAPIRTIKKHLKLQQFILYMFRTYIGVKYVSECTSR